MNTRQLSKTLWCLMLSIVILSPLAAQTTSEHTDVINFLSQKFEVDGSSLVVVDSHEDKKFGKTFYYVQQVIGGVEVFNAITTVVKAKGNYYAVGARSYDLDQIATTTSRMDNSTMINAAINDVLGKKASSINSKLKKEPSRYHTLSDVTLSTESIFTKPIYYPDLKGNLQYAMEVNVWSDVDEVWHQRIVLESDGSIIKTQGWTVECNFGHGEECSDTHREHDHNITARSFNTSSGIDSSYNVLAMPVESPVYGSRTTEETPWSDAVNASPFGWHDLDGVAGPDTTVTYGNNVRAYEDTANANEPGEMPDGGTNFCFDFPFDDTMSPAEYREAATVNLFYWNNIVHDVMYQYGFTEDAGNFQLINYSGVGGDDDFVNAECQDGSGTNNANFSSPVDGSNGRMQMFLWNISSEGDTVRINSPADIAGDYEALAGGFGPVGVSVEENIVMAIPNEACDPITNGASLDGKIAMIDRGNCTFVSKIEAAQAEGAIGVIICNNVGTDIFTMGGSSTIIDIPSVMMSQADCEEIKMELSDGFMVNGEIILGPSSQRDSDFDNGVIIHEYGHGVSIRLTGGPNNSGCLSNSEQMGEGWSDYLGLMLTMEADDIGDDSRGIGNYLQGQDETGGGIRPNPYSTDFGVNPHTYTDISTVSVPHGVGSVWCAMLWEMTWDLIDEYGFDPDIYNGIGGNNMALQLVMDGMKMQPCGPGFVDGRDAILLADELNNNGDNQCIIWEAFARRGLGWSADQGSTGSVDDGAEAFDLPPACQDILAVLKSVDKATAVNGDTINYTLFGFNQTDNDLTNVQMHDTLDSQLNYIAGSLTTGTESGGIILVDLQDFNIGDESEVTFSAEVNTGDTNIAYYDPVEFVDATWAPTTGQGSDAFTLSTANPHLDNQSWFIPNVGADNTHYVTSQEFALDANAGLSFWHDYDTESGWDGGYVEYSDDGGSTWTNLNGFFVKNGYNSVLGQNQNNDIANQPAFSGNSSGYINSIIDLSHLEGETVTFRFTFGSDDNTFSHGWYVDDVSLYEIGTITNVACITSDEGEMYCDTVKTLIETDCSRFYRLYIDNDGDGSGVDTDSIFSCDLMAGYSPIKGDCDDTDPNLSNIQVEVCDGIDNDCDGLIDEVCTGMLICDEDELFLMINDEVYSIAAEQIQSVALLNQLDSTFYYAGDTITLNAGFEVELGKSFDAIIEDCADNIDN